MHAMGSHAHLLPLQQVMYAEQRMYLVTGEPKKPQQEAAYVTRCAQGILHARILPVAVVTWVHADFWPLDLAHF